MPDKATQIGILIVAGLALFLGWKWSKRRDESETSSAPDDVARLERFTNEFRTRRSGKRWTVRQKVIELQRWANKRSGK